MRFGVNYIPSRRWLHSWLDFDEQSIREDLLAIRSLGFDHIRAHLLWSYFQVNPRQMSPRSMENLERFVSLCEETGLDFVLSLFTGWMSGFYFIPAWMRFGQDFGMFSDPAYREPQRFYIREIAKTVAKSPAFLGFDLGNELSCVVSRDKAYSMAVCDDWHRDMLLVCEEEAPGKLHSNGVDQQPWFGDFSFSRGVLSNTGAVNALHCWTYFTGAYKRGGLLGTASTRLADYMAALAKAYSRDPRRPVWLQEFGCSKLWCGKPGESVEAFTRKTLDALPKIPDLWGFTWWCSHDIGTRFAGFQDLEYDLGLLDAGNRVKPAGELMARWIAGFEKDPVTPAPRRTAMLYRPDRNGEDLWGNADRFMDLLDRGIEPQIVLPEHAEDAAWLSARGIEETIE